ncbi:hypothetical protein CGCS363_v014507 [Colletotrichum siamense]|uniref:uncharacterized protein n=1 Tax=Colletotrichum siamense TaxID=690259 RepID=UPI001872BE0E|nr:uncharacterized protein CGCS363_v014507 [Colletotrichum siamense]KAF5484712.1 hypothetical protein CGCS363_v014507 [Colletotrichum siamense]
MTYSRAQRRAQERNEKLLRLDGQGVHFPPGACLGSDKIARMAMRILGLEPSELCPKPEYKEFEFNVWRILLHTTRVADDEKDIEFNSHPFWSKVLDRCLGSIPFKMTVVSKEGSKHGRGVKNAIFRIVNTYRKARRSYVQLHMDEDNSQPDNTLLGYLDELEELEKPHLRNQRRNRRKLRNGNRDVPQILQDKAALTTHDRAVNNAPCANDADSS